MLRLEVDSSYGMLPPSRAGPEEAVLPTIPAGGLSCTKEGRQPADRGRLGRGLTFRWKSGRIR